MIKKLLEYLYENLFTDEFKRVQKLRFAPLTEGERESFNFFRKLFRFVAVSMAIGSLGFFIYQLYYDSTYKMQIQVTWISVKYLVITSQEAMLVLVILILLCLLRRRIWYAAINLYYLDKVTSIYDVVKKVDLYHKADHNGLIHLWEMYNYKLNIYLYKLLTKDQIDWVVLKELEIRKSLCSILLYKECRPLDNDPFIVHFFDDFRIDYADADSYERIRNQIEIYQIAKLKLGKWQYDYFILQDAYNHPIRHFFRKAYDITWIGVTEYMPEILFYSFCAMILTTIIWYNFVEDPLWVRMFPSFFKATLDPNTPNSAVSTIAEAIAKEPALNSDMSKEFVRNFIGDSKDNFGQLPPELMQAAFDKMFPFGAKAASQAAAEGISKAAAEGISKATAEAISKAAAEAAAADCEAAAAEMINKLNDFMNNSPFEQFEVLILQRISFFGLDFSFSNLTLYLLLAIFVILGFSVVIKKSLSLIPNYWQSVIEIFYSFIFSMLIDQAGKRAKVFFPAIFSLFFFILVSNLLGLIPLSFAVTSHVVITFCLGFGFFVAWIIVAFKTIGLKIFNIFWPTNVPLWLRPLLMVVEILSFSLRPLSLSIRLFVNILAGHILLHLVSGSVVLVFTKAAIFSFIPFVLLLAVFCLELGIAFLQAYIFSILLCIYLHDSYHVHGH